MKTRITVALASVVVASFGIAAYAQDAPQVPPQPTSTTASPYTSSNPSSDQMSSPSSSGDMTSSSNIEQKVKHALTAHGVTATDVQVSFSNGTATLTGTVATHRDMILTVRDRIAKLIDSGKSEDDAVAAKVLADFDAKVDQAGTTGDRFVRQVYAELKATR